MSTESKPTPLRMSARQFRSRPMPAAVIGGVLPTMNTFAPQISSVKSASLEQRYRRTSAASPTTAFSAADSGSPSGDFAQSMMAISGLSWGIWSDVDLVPQRCASAEELVEVIVGPDPGPG